ncbi:MAG: hypothetical protein U1D55_12625 [Phycisphaerae bacterium]
MCAPPTEAASAATRACEAELASAALRQARLIDLPAQDTEV